MLLLPLNGKRKGPENIWMDSLRCCKNSKFVRVILLSVIEGTINGQINALVESSVQYKVAKRTHKKEDEE